MSPHSYPSFVLLGDFNIDFSDSTHHNFCKLRVIASLHSLTQMVSDPTHAWPGGSSTIIDLVLVSNENTVVDCSTTPPLANSDHSGSKSSAIGGTLVSRSVRSRDRYGALKTQILR